MFMFGFSRVVELEVVLDDEVVVAVEVETEDEDEQEEGRSAPKSASRGYVIPFTCSTHKS